jgi:hypothetical protein
LGNIRIVINIEIPNIAQPYLMNPFSYLISWTLYCTDVAVAAAIADVQLNTRVKG